MTSPPASPCSKARAGAGRTRLRPATAQRTEPRGTWRPHRPARPVRPAHLGGGRVLDPLHRHASPPRRTAGATSRPRSAEPEQALPPLLASATNGIDPQSRNASSTARAKAGSCRTAYWRSAHGWAHGCSTRRWRELEIALLDSLQRFHEEQPDELGPDRDRLRRYALPQLERPVFIALLEQAPAAGHIETSGPSAAPPRSPGAPERCGRRLESAPVATARSRPFRPTRVRDPPATSASTKRRCATCYASSPVSACCNRW